MRADKVVGREIDEAALKYQRAHPEVSYEKALEAAMQENPELAKEFVATFSHVSAKTARAFGIEDAGDEDAGTIAAEKEIDRLTLAYMREHPTEKDYSKALQIVLARHPDLKMRWVKNYGSGVHTSNFEHVVAVEYDEKKASAAVNALLKKIRAEHPDWTDEACLQEARARLKKKGARITELSEEVQNARDRARALLDA